MRSGIELFFTSVFVIVVVGFSYGIINVIGRRGVYFGIRLPRNTKKPRKCGPIVSNILLPSFWSVCF